MKACKNEHKILLEKELTLKLKKFEDLFIKLVIPKIEKKIKLQKKLHNKETDKKYKSVKSFITRPNTRTIKKAFNFNKIIFKKEKQNFKLEIFKKKFNEQMDNFSNTIHKLNRINERLILNSKNLKMRKRKFLKKNVTNLKKKEKNYLRHKVTTKKCKDKLIEILLKHVC